MADDDQAVGQLPTIIVSPGDLKRLRRDLESIDDFLREAALRSGGQPTKMPALSPLVDALAVESGVNLLQSADRQKLLSQVNRLVEEAPKLHISFAAEPSASFMSKLVIWLRANIHPMLLIHVGLQPSIAAGCIVRTVNKQFDFSLAQAFDRQRHLLIDGLKTTGTNAIPGPNPKSGEAAT